MNSRLVANLQRVVAVNLSNRDLQNSVMLDVVVALLSNGAVDQNASILCEVVCNVGDLTANGNLVLVGYVDLVALLEVVSCEGDGLFSCVYSKGLALNRSVSSYGQLIALSSVLVYTPDACNLCASSANRNVGQLSSGVRVAGNALEVRDSDLVVLGSLLDVGASLCR